MLLFFAKTPLPLSSSLDSKSSPCFTFIMNTRLSFKFLIFAGTFSLLIERQFVSSNAAVITSVNYAFETFSPYALIRFFEFSDKEWNITEKCFRDMYVYVNGLRSGEYWAVKCKISYSMNTNLVTIS